MSILQEVSIAYKVAALALTLRRFMLLVEQHHTLKGVASTSFMPQPSGWGLALEPEKHELAERHPLARCIPSATM